ATLPLRAPAAGDPGTISAPARRARARCIRVGHRLMGAYAVFYRSGGQAPSWMCCLGLVLELPQRLAAAACDWGGPCASRGVFAARLWRDSGRTMAARD